jgi:hypothetical protein
VVFFMARHVERRKTSLCNKKTGVMHFASASHLKQKKTPRAISPGELHALK